MLSILIAICSVIGLPWFVAATVLAMTHVNSLRMESESSAPGEKPQFLGVRLACHEPPNSSLGRDSCLVLSFCRASTFLHHTVRVAQFSKNV